MKKHNILSKLKRISRKIACIIATAVMCLNNIGLNQIKQVSAQTSMGNTYKITENDSTKNKWQNTDKNGDQMTHRFSSYESDKSKALKVDASYGFKLQKTSATKVTVVKGTKCAAPSKFNGENLGLPAFMKKYTWFKTSKNTANNIQIKISDLTVYQCNSDGSNGHWVKVDLVRTITGIEKYKNQNGYIALGSGITDAAYIAIEEMTVNNTFYKAGTSQKVTLKSNVTLTDIDTRQYIGVSASKIDGQYVSNNTTLSYLKNGNKNFYYADNDINYSGEAKTAVGFIFEDSSFVYTFGRIRSDGPTNQEQYVGTGQSMTEFEPSSPVKTVTDQDEKGVKENTVEHLGENWTYTVEQSIPSNIPSNFYYDNFSFEDQVESCMKINSIRVEAENAEAKVTDATSMFKITSSGNKVVAKLKNSKNANFYKNTVYRLKINVQMNIPDGATESQMEELRNTWKEHGHYKETENTITENNSAKTIIDGKNLPTNQVKTNIEGPKKTVSDQDESKVVKNNVRDLGSNWTYSVTQKIAQNATEPYDSFVFRDEIEECMKINSVKVINDQGNDVSGWFDITTTANHVVASLKDPKNNKDFYKNAAYTMEINVQMDIPTNVTEEQMQTLKETWEKHGHYSENKTVLKENNVAYVEINGVNSITNRPETEIHLSTTTDQTPGLHIVKSVNRYEHQVNDIIHYTVKVNNTNEKADTAYFVIRDVSLPDSVAFDFSSVKVSGIDAENYTIEQVGNGWVLKSKGDYALPFGKTITIEYDAKALTASNGTVIDNTATAIAAGIPEKKDAKQVYVNSPKIDVEKTAPSSKYKVGDSVGYKVVITNRNPGTFMRDLLLKDEVQSKGLEIKEGSVAVLVAGKDVTSNLDITYAEDGSGFRIQTPYNMNNSDIPCIGISPYKEMSHWTDKMIVTYEATITDEAALSTDLKNTFSAPATKNTNGDLIKDDELIPSGGGQDDADVKMKAPALEITKKSNKTQYNVGENGIYELVVKQTKENLIAKNVVVTDTFVQQEGVKYDTSSLKVLLNKEDITQECKISVEGNQFKIETGKDLTDEDKLVIDYQVNFEKEGQYTNTAVSKADNTNEDQANNVVEVKEITPELSIKKSSDKQEYAVGNTGTYTLTVKEKKSDATAKNVIVKDQFATGDGISIVSDSIAVTLNKKDITKDCKITANETEFLIETGKDMTSKDELQVTYQVSFAKTGTYQNTAITKGDNAEEVEADNTVDVKKQDVTITKDADQKRYKVGDTVKYKVKVGLKKENTISKNVVIRDQIPDELKLDEKSIKVEGITDYTIHVDGNKMEVKIPTLKYGEEVIVTYEAKVLKGALGKTLTNKANVNGEGINGGEAKVTVEVPKTTKTTPGTSTPSTPSSSHGTNGSMPKTGDMTNATPYAVAIILAGIAAAIIYKKKKK